MSQTGYTPISLYYSATASAAPVAGNLVAGELAINTNDGKLYYKDSAGVVQTLASKSATSGTYTNITVTGGSINGTTIGATTASTGAFTSLSASSTVTFSGGTANGVGYLNGSKVLTTGSALTWDGNQLAIGAYVNSGGLSEKLTINGNGLVTQLSNQTNRSMFGSFGGSTTIIGSFDALPLEFRYNNSEQMRLTSTGLGIGTSSPSQKLDIAGQFRVDGTGNVYGKADNTGFISVFGGGVYNSGAGIGLGGSGNGTANTIVFTRGNYVESARIDSAGNLGLGVTPSAWYSGWKALQGSDSSSFAVASAGQGMYVLNNAYLDAATNWKYTKTGYASYYQQYNGAHTWYNAASGTAGNPITFTQAMTLDASGNLGVGTTSPSSYAKFATRGYVTTGSVNYSGLFSDAVNSSLYIGHTSTTVNLLSDTAITFATGGSPASFTERARIDSSGNLLVGTTSNSRGARLRVEGIETAYFTGYGNGYGIGLWMTPNASATGGTATAISFQNVSNTTVGSITTSASATLYNVTSDQRLKENIVDSPEFGSVIDSLQVRSFDWKTDQTHQRAGFVAQELVTVAPEAVYQPDDVEQMMAVDYSKLVPMLVKEIQSLRKRLLALESK